MKIFRTILVMVTLTLFLSCSGGKSSLLTLIEVEGGSFIMGTEEGEKNERPAHEVTVGDFYISSTEITQAQWVEVMGENPVAEDSSYGVGEEYPVYLVSWTDAVAFCNAMSERDGLDPAYSGSGSGLTCDFTSEGYRLPTEAEWEYAARGGAESAGYLYAGSNDLDEVGWYSLNSDGASHPVGTKAPNELGIYDMSGNLWEWCWDYYGARYYEEAPSDFPTGPESATYRVLRGGSRAIVEKSNRVYFRYYGAHRSDESTGFRVVRTQ